jgi:hypothetical protein
MSRVIALILHPEPDSRAGPLERWVAAARRNTGEAHRLGFLAAGAAEAEIVSGGPDGMPFGARLRASVERLRPDGLVVLGSGAVPLASAADRRAFVATAARRGRFALANNAYSADVVAVAEAMSLLDLPDLATDNALPRWLAESAAYTVADLRRRWRLGIDIDGPIDLILLGRRPPDDVDAATIGDRLGRIRELAAQPSCELVVTGRVSGPTLVWLERHTASRTRALVEERGLRTSVSGQRPPRSVLGALLDRDGPASLGAVLAQLGDAALVDSRVLLAHRYGPDQAAWPSPEDRFASDLLLHQRIRDPWLREITRSAAEATIPVVLGGHTLVGPGLRLALRPERRRT